MSTVKIDIRSGYSYKNATGSVETFELENLLCDSSKSVVMEAWKGATVHLTHISIEKKIYSPNVVRCELQVDTKDPSISDIIEESLLEGRVTVYDETMKSGEYILKDYLIHEVVPTVFSGSQFTKVNFVAYSPDQMLCYDKYSMAYTTKRLCGDIVPSQLKGVLREVFTTDMFQQDTLHNTSCNKKEIIMPYLMQYNESFYNFLRRVTYRSGEYLFFEDGKLHIGLDVPEEEPVLVNYDSKSSKGRHFSRLSAHKITSHHHDISSEDSSDLFSDSVAFNEEYSHEDYATTIDSDPNEMEWAKSGDSWVEVLNDVLSQDDYFEMGKTAMGDILGGIAKDKIDTGRKNKEHNEKYKFKENKGSKIDMYGVNEDESESYRPYMMYDSLDMLIGNAYREIRLGEEKTRGGMQTLQLSRENDKFTNYSLGQIVAIPGTTRKYVVVRVSREDMSDNADAGRYSLDIVPLTFDEDSIFPPMQDDIEPVRTMGPQTAFITSTKDAANMGRVQVRFHWQTKDGDATPLIRLSQQMASDDAGVFFTPNTNDEVIVNFTNGNADMPYVSGFLFNKRNMPPEDKRTIRSSHGHHITFNDKGENADFAKSLIPIWKPAATWWELCNSSSDELKEKLEDAKTKCNKALETLKATGGKDYLAYDKKCKTQAFRKEFMQKAQNIIVDDPVLTDSTIGNKRFEMQDAKTSFKEPTDMCHIWNSGNKMDDLREEIKQQKATYPDRSDHKNLQEFYDNAMAIKESEVRQALTPSEDKKQDMRYNTAAQAETEANRLLLPSTDELDQKKDKKNNIAKLQDIIDDVDNESCEKIIKPDTVTQASKEYTQFVDAFNKVVAAKKKVDDASSSSSDDKYQTGGITLADDSGLYKLDLNATKRAITIDSPLGTVSINAMTGITISAPNGDVKISGKNVSIEAGNNLSITAGKNISKWNEFKEKFTKDNALETTVGGVADFGEAFTPDFVSDYFLKPVIDMKAVRCVMECFVRPAEGTLKLHTENNLMLEAGGEKTTADMSSMKHTYNQSKVKDNRAKKTAAAIACLNNIFSEINTLCETSKANLTSSTTALKNYINTEHANANQRKVIAMLNTNFGTDATAICASIIRAATQAPAGGGAAPKPVTSYTMDFIYNATANNNVALNDLKATSEKKFEANPSTRGARDEFNSIIAAKDLMAELNKALKLVNALAGSFANKAFVEKSDELKKYSTWFLDGEKDKMLGLKEDTFKNIANYVGGMTLKADGKVYFGGTSEVTADELKLKKRKYFQDMIAAMLTGKSKGFFETVFTGSPESAMAYYKSLDGKIPTISDENIKKDDEWKKYVEKLQKYEADDSSLASALNTVGSTLVEDKLMGGMISKMVSGYKGIFDEVASHAVESQGHIYLTAKDSSTVKLNATALQPSTGLKSKLEDIKSAMLE